MTYELAKQLKDGGFPFNRTCGNCGRHCDLEDVGEESGIMPTLSELIEACGDNQFRLIAHYVKNELVWLADQYPFNECSVDRPVGDGSSPEEAVARLWLAIGSKSKASGEPHSNHPPEQP